MSCRTRATHPGNPGDWVHGIGVPRALIVCFAVLCLSPLAARANGVCDRTQQVREAIVAAVHADDCAAVTDSALKDLTALDLQDQSISTLSPGDFDGLIRLQLLNLSGNDLGALPSGLFDPLSSLRSLSLHDNRLASLPADLFDQLHLLDDLTLHGNQLTALPDGMFDDLSRFHEVHLGQELRGLDRLRQFLQSRAIATPEQFVEALPELHKQRFGFVYGSDGLGSEFVTGTHPRVISWGADARFVFAWTTNPDTAEEFRNSVEFLIPSGTEWAAGVVDFSGPAPEIVQPASCQSCHGSLNKPLWGTYDGWAGTETNLKQIDVEFRSENMRNLIESTNERVAPLDFSGSVFPHGHDRRFLKPSDGLTPYMLGVEELGTVLGLRHAGVLFQRLKSSADYAEFAEETVCSSSPVQAAYSRFESTSDSTIGVMLNRQQPVQGFSGTSDAQFPDYHFKAAGGTIGQALVFLILHDLWSDHAEVRQAYREVSNGSLPQSSIDNQGHLFYPAGSANAEDELIQIYRLHFGHGNGASLDAIDAANPTELQLGNFTAGLGDGHIFTMLPRVCSALKSKDTLAHNLTAWAGSDGSVNLSWDAPRVNADVTGYRIQRGPVAGTLEVLVPDSGSTATTYADAAVAPGTGYAYSVIPLRGSAVGGESNQATVRTPLPAQPAFSVSAEPQAIKEGERATLTVAVSNGFTFATDQTVTLAVSGTASSADYTLVPAQLALVAGQSSATAELTALDDTEEEADETVTLTASHAGAVIGAATVTIASVSHDATLSALSLSGIDIGTFSSATTAYQATVAHSVTTTTVTAVTTHAGATPVISPANPVTLAEGPNPIAVTVTAEDGTTTQTYTVTVTREGPPEVSIAALPSPVTEGAPAEFQVTLDKAAAATLTVALSVTESGSMLSATAPASLTFSAGDTSLPLSVSTVGDSEYEPDSTVTVSVAAGAGYAAGAAFSASVTVEDDDAPRPNILVFLSDDMGWGQPGFNGGTEVATPNLDRIANEGVKLTQFYVQPLCSPTRASLLTGRYPWKNGMEHRPSVAASQGMLTDERTLAEALRDAGYATWIVGKWHLGQWHSQHLPLQRGFEHHYGHYSGEIDSFTLHRGRGRRGILDWHRNERPVVESGYSTFLMAREAIELIERHDDADPFFLYLPFNAVHNPNDAPQEYIDLYTGSSEPKQRAQLKAMDVAVGRVLAALEQKGVLDDTLVMFLNDNGGPASAGWNRPYRGKKSEFHEGGIRVPTVLRWPEGIPAGSESDALLHVVDLFPTLAGLADADASAGLPLDGLDVWGAISADAASPRTEVVYSLDVIRMGDWKLLDDGIDHYGFTTDVPELYNIADDPYETTNLAATEAAKVAELRERLAHHAQFARAGESPAEIPNHPPVMYGEDENAAFGPQAYRAVTQLRSGNPGPTLVRLEAVGNTVRLTYDEWLDAGSVPPPSAFTVVLDPRSSYTRTEVTDVAVGGSQVELTLAQSAPVGTTVGLTYEVPDSGAVRDEDQLEAVGFVWRTAAATAAFLSLDATLSALSLSGIDIGTFSSATTAYQATVAHSVTTTAVTATPTHPGATVAISPASPVTLAEGANPIAVTVTAQDGITTQTYTLTVTREGPPEVTIAAVSSPVAEGASADFEVRLAKASLESLTVAVRVTESGSMLSRAPPHSVTFSPGDASAPLSVPTAGDRMVEADSAVTATLVPGTGYAVGPVPTASVTVEDDDDAVFAVSAAPPTIREGERATLTVAISNGVTFAENQAIELAASGTASAADYGPVPASLTLLAGAPSATAQVTASEDNEEEADETLAIAASHRGIAIGSATVTIVSVSHDATLSALSLSGIDIGTFTAATTTYQARVAHAVTATTVTATPAHPKAKVTIEPPSPVSLVEGANEIAVTVTAEDGTTTKTYTVTVTRAGLPEVTIAPSASLVTEGTAAAFEVRLDTAASEALTVPVDVRETGSMLSGTPPSSVTFSPGDASAVLNVPTAGDTVVEADSAVTATVAPGTGYTVGPASTASVTVEDDDDAVFAVSAAPATIREGERATLTVAISNGVTFAENQTIELAASGTASAADYGPVPAALTLLAGAPSATAEVTASKDEEEEADETLVITASHGGAAIGSATVTIASVSHDATLGSLSLSGIDIGTFTGATTAYQASVAHSVTATTVTASPSHPEATVSIAPGPR